jgi:hypothetical protein
MKIFRKLFLATEKHLKTNKSLQSVGYLGRTKKNEQKSNFRNAGRFCAIVF